MQSPGHMEKNEKVVKTPEEALQLLKKNILIYYPQADFERLDKAFKFSKDHHQGQLRRSGDAYIMHPLGVALVLSEMHMDLDTIITGLLHDTVEDTLATLEAVEKLFGPVVTKLVDGVTKISQMSFKNTHEKQSENIRKMIVAMGRDIRVIIVKLADRLHNMRTLNHMPLDKQISIAQETLDIYAPLANRLGIGWVKIELEDLSLRYLKPEIYFNLASKVSKKRKEREKYIQEVIDSLESELRKDGVADAKVLGRPKHFYSIYKKMEESNISYEQVYDVIAFRILVDNVVQCYTALGIIHNIWKPVPGRFKDFIAMPKANNYQSLHTTVIGPGGERIEVQIRTHEMQLIAERGIAAHWKYKEGGVDKETEKKFEWLHNLIQAHQQLKDPSEFLESIKTDLFAGDVYVFTPRGDIMEFPFGSTPLDFAYAVHTDVGNKTVAAKINGKIVPLKHKLKNGDTLEIITAPHQKPSKDWLKIAQTSRARSKIRAFIKSEERARSISLGKEIVEKNFKKHGLHFDTYIKGPHLEKMLKDLGLGEVNDIFVRVGYGKISPLRLIEIIAPEKLQAANQPEEPDSFLKKVFKSAIEKTKSNRSAIKIHGMTDILVRFAKCCSPIPGDPIVGFISRGRGITVHLADCPKAYDKDAERRVDVEWGLAEDNERVAKIRVVCVDVPGLLQKMSETFTGMGINIHQAQVRTTKDNKAISQFEVNIKNISQLNKALKALEGIKGVISVERVKF